MELRPIEQKDLSMVRGLYQTAFPRAERKPFSRILRNCRRGRMELLVIWEEKQYAGFFITAVMEDMVLVDYFAVPQGKRNRGIGGRALALLRRQYPGKVIFLEIEKIEEQAENASQRKKRKAFYLKNGMMETGISWKMFGVPMEILSFTPLSREDTERMYGFLYGRFWFLPIRPM